MTNPQQAKLATPGFQGVDPNLFDDPKKRQVGVVMVVGPSGQPASFGASDLASNREATQQQVLAAIQALKVSTLAPLSRQTLTLASVAQGLTVPAGATAARISVRGGNASVAVMTPAPTATEGDLWPDGSMWELNKNELAGFRAVIASGAPVLHITYLGVAT